MERLANTLHTISPLATLDRGYAIVTHTTSGKIIKDINKLKKGTQTTTRVTNGIILSKIIETNKNDS